MEQGPSPPPPTFSRMSSINFWLCLLLYQPQTKNTLKNRACIEGYPSLLGRESSVIDPGKIQFGSLRAQVSDHEKSFSHDDGTFK